MPRPTSRRQSSPRRMHALSLEAARVSDAPNSTVAVLSDQQSAIMGYGDADRSAPNALIVHNEAGQKVIVLTRGHAMVKPDANNLIACARRPVPRAVQRGK